MLRRETALKILENKNCVRSYTKNSLSITFITINNNNHNTNNNKQFSVKFKSDAAWSLCNAFRHSTSKPKLIFLKFGFFDILLSLIGIDKFHKQQIQIITVYMGKIVKSTVIHQDDNNQQSTSTDTQIYVNKLKYILQQQSDQTLLKNLKRILDIIQSALHYTR